MPKVKEITDVGKLAHIIYNAIGDGSVNEKDGIDFLKPILASWKREIVNSFYDAVLELFKRINRKFE